MSLAKTVASVAARHGAEYTLRREVIAVVPQTWKSGSSTVSYFPMVARERYYKPNEIKGTIQENDALLVVDAATLTQLPAVNDRVALGSFVSDISAEWRHVVSVYEARERGSVRVYRLQVRR